MYWLSYILKIRKSSQNNPEAILDVKELAFLN
jgi:hypothetical protein